MRSSGPRPRRRREALEGELLEARGERRRASSGRWSRRSARSARRGRGRARRTGVVGPSPAVSSSPASSPGACRRSRRSCPRPITSDAPERSIAVFGLEPAEADRERQQHGADGGDGDLERDVAPHVRQRDGDHVAGLDAARAQVGGERQHRAQERVEAQLLALVVDGERVAAGRGVGAQVAQRVVTRRAWRRWRSSAAPRRFALLAARPGRPRRRPRCRSRSAASSSLMLPAGGLAVGERGARDAFGRLHGERPVRR